MFDKVIKLASKYPNTFVFGGYVRDVMLSGLDESKIKDLDLFFQKEKDVWNFIETISIFCPLIATQIHRGTKRNGYLNNESDVISCVFTDNSKNYNIDCVFPNTFHGSHNRQDTIEPVSYENGDMDVNMFFLKLDGNKSQLQICSPPEEELSINPDIGSKAELFFIKTLRAIQHKKFRILNTPQDLPKCDLRPRYSQINVIRIKGIKLLARADKMVKRGWTQENVKNNRRQWHVIKFENIKNSCDKGPWSDVAHIVKTENKCCICQGEYEDHHNVLMSPCGHTCHVFCSDYCTEKDEIRENTGFAGWIKAAIKRSAETRRMNLPIVERHMSCLLCNHPIF